MGMIYSTFQRELDSWANRYADSPEREMVALCLLALEREELVAIAYHEDLIAQRLASMPVSNEIREIIQHALVWAWKDEEMHAIYVRGALLKIGNWNLRLQTFCRQMAGAIGGWAASVRQHVRWRKAPFSRTCATALTGVGSLFGKVPSEIRQHLSYGPFRNFCSFNVEAEKTAWLCWKRMAELAEKIPGLPASTVSDFRRVQADEERHARVFEILALALDENDELVEGESPESLCSKIGAVSEYFLARNKRKEFITRNPLGSGGRVYVERGANSGQKRELFRSILDQSGLEACIRARAKESEKRITDLSVAIKPTFMLGYDRRDTSMITDPELVDALARYLKDLGCGDVAVVEARNIYDQFFDGRTVQEVAAYFKIRSPHYRLVDGNEEQVPHAYYRGLAQHSVARSWKDADFRISFGKMRSHPIELAYLTVGNVEWMGDRCDEFIFAERQAQRETAIMMLLDQFPPHFALLDAYESAADGLVGVMGCPRPKQPLRFYAGVDALAVDMVAARHMSMRSVRDSSVLRAACHWFGNPEDRIKVVGIDEPLEDWKDPYHNEISTILSLVAFPVYVMGSGRGSLFVPEMDQSAFPLIRPETFWQNICRRGTRRLLGLHHPRIQG
jgi:uncharacterized protein (DUF362 family)